MSTSAISSTAMDAWSGVTSLTGGTSIPWVSDDVLWLLIVGFIAAFILSFAVGANDVANSFGTAVGAKVLTLRQACILGTVFETAGAVLLGAKVGEMIRKGIIDVGVYNTENGAELLMMGEVAAMIGSGVWQLIATVFKVPVSGTHSIVGACIGFSLVAVGSNGVTWSNLGLIVASWFISPVLSGIMAVGLYYFVQRFILETKNPLENGLKILPVFYATAIGVNIISILISGAPLLGFNDLPMWGTLLISAAGMLVVGFVAQCYAVPRVRARAEKSIKEKFEIGSQEDVESVSQASCTKNSVISELLPDSSRCEGSIQKQIFDEFENAELATEERGKFVRFNEETSGRKANSKVADESCTSFAVQLTESSSSLDQRDIFNMMSDDSLKTLNFPTDCQNKEVKLNPEEDDEEEDPPEVRHLFSAIQILTACFASFAHGGNDVSNAIGPLIALWIVFWSGSVVQTAFTPWYLLLCGGAGISIGLWLCGKRVMETIGNDLTKMTPSRGFCIELMTAITVLLASNLGVPISTTHCKVGAVVSIGWYRSRSAVHWSVVRNIAFAWFVTVPVSGLLSAGAMFVLMQFQ